MVMRPQVPTAGNTVKIDRVAADAGHPAQINGVMIDGPEDR
jgi:hypothetical protein